MEDEILRQELAALRKEHTKLDKIIAEGTLDPFTTQRLKKEKLKLKDRISYIESLLYPDIIA